MHTPQNNDRKNNAVSTNEQPPHVFFFTNGTTTGVENLYVNFSVTEIEKRSFFMDDAGNFLHRSCVTSWHNVRMNGTPKPFVKFLPQKLVPAAKKIADFISDCMAKNVIPTKELWDKKIADEKEEKEKRLAEIRNSANALAAEKDAKEKRLAEIRKTADALAAKKSDLEMQEAKRKEFLKHLRKNIDRDYEKRTISAEKDALLKQNNKALQNLRKSDPRKKVA